MTRKGKIVFAIATVAFTLGTFAMLGRAPQVVPVPALTPAEMVEVSPGPAQVNVDEELFAAQPDPDGNGS